MSAAPRRAARELVIWGSGGHAREICDLAAALAADGGPYRLIGLLDDDPARHGREVDGHPVLGGEDWLRGRATRPALVIGVGRSRARAGIARRLASLGLDLPALVHPSAVLTGRVHLGAGTMVAAGAVLTTGVTLGDHAHVNVGASLSHDVELGPCASVGPGSRLTGAARLGEGCDLGAGVVLIPSISVGEWSILGAGAVVTRDLPANVTAVGAPARVVRTRPAGWHLEAPEGQPRS